MTTTDLYSYRLSRSRSYLLIYSKEIWESHPCCNSLFQKKLVNSENRTELLDQIFGQAILLVNFFSICISTLSMPDICFVSPCLLAVTITVGMI